MSWPRTEAEVPALRDAIGGVYSAYAEMSRAAMTDGRSAAGSKSSSPRHRGDTASATVCIGATPRRVQGGSHRNEVAEAMAWLIMMNGGPGTVWGPRAFAAFEEYAAADPRERAEL